MNEFVLKPRVFCRVKNLYEPVNPAPEPGNLAAARVAGRPDVQRYCLPGCAGHGPGIRQYRRQWRCPVIALLTLVLIATRAALAALEPAPGFDRNHDLGGASARSSSQPAEAAAAFVLASLRRGCNLITVFFGRVLPSRKTIG
jgi:hypothetical protein